MIMEQINDDNDNKTLKLLVLGDPTATSSFMKALFSSDDDESYPEGDEVVVPVSFTDKGQLHKAHVWHVSCRVPWKKQLFQNADSILYLCSYINPPMRLQEDVLRHTDSPIVIVGPHVTPSSGSGLFGVVHPRTPPQEQEQSDKTIHYFVPGSDIRFMTEKDLSQFSQFSAKMLFQSMLSSIKTNDSSFGGRFSFVALDALAIQPDVDLDDFSAQKIEGAKSEMTKSCREEMLFFDIQDVEFSCENNVRVGAHAAILAGASDYFKKLFDFAGADKQADGTYRQSPQVGSKPASAQVVKAVLKHIYTGHPDDSLDVGQLDDVLDLASQYLLTDLIADTETLFVDKLSVQTVNSVLQAAHQYKLTKLFDASVDFIVENLVEVFIESNVQSLEKTKPELWKKVTTAVGANKKRISCMKSF